MMQSDQALGQICWRKGCLKTKDVGVIEERSQKKLVFPNFVRATPQGTPVAQVHHVIVSDVQTSMENEDPVRKK